MNKILIVDDKANIRLLLKEYLEEQGFDVTTANNGRAAIFATRESPPDLILLDIMMPEMDGFEFLSYFRQHASTPIIMLTAREEEADTVRALEMGADDYVTKPCRMKELTARIRAQLRRAHKPIVPNKLFRAGPLSLDPHQHLVTLNDQPINLTPTEFTLLHTLIQSPNQLFTRDALLTILSASGYTGAPRTINVHIRNLRNKIEADPSNPQLIITVFGVGYRFEKES